MSPTEDLARHLYTAYRFWAEINSGHKTPTWEKLAVYYCDGYLKLAEMMTLEDR